MSYGIQAYRCDLGKVTAVFGSKDAPLRSHILEVCRARLAGLQEQFSSSSHSAKDVLQELLEGKITRTDAGYLYWYVLQMLIEGFGKALPNDRWYPAPVDPLLAMKAFRQYDVGISGLPRPDDFPLTLVCRRENLEALSADAEQVSDAEQRAQLLHWVAEATAKKQDLVLYYY